MRHLLTLLATTALTLVATTAAAEPELPTRLDTPEGTVAQTALDGARPAPAIATKREPAKAEVSVVAPTPAPLATKSSGFPMGWMIAVGAGLASVALIAVLQKKRNIFAVEETIKVVAAKQLGPKARIVLVETRGRELLLSVGDRGAALISDWWVDDERASDVAAKAEPDLPFELLDPEEVVPKDFADHVAAKNRATRAYAASTPRAEEPSRPSPAATPVPAPLPFTPKAAPSSDANSAVSGLVRLRTKSTTSATPRIERKEARTTSKDAAALDLASDLYGQWSKSLISNGR